MLIPRRKLLRLGAASLLAAAAPAIIGKANAQLMLTGAGGAGINLVPPATTFQGAVAKNTADKTAQNFSAGVIQTFSADEVDTDAFHDTGSNTGRLTIPSAVNGKYGIIQANINLDALGGDQDFYAQIFNSGGTAAYIGAGYRCGTSDSTVGGTANWFSVQTSPLLLNTGDFYTVSVYCNDTSVTLVAAATSFSIYIVG